MPVDFCACVLPLLILVAGMGAAAGGRDRKAWRRVAGALLAVFLLIYFVPGWALQGPAERGDREAQFALGNYYWRRLGKNWPDIEARDKWWVEAAKQGHPRAMYQVGYFSRFGTSQYIPRDLVAARQWLEAAQAAGDPDAADGIRSLAQEEARAARSK